MYSMGGNSQDDYHHIINQGNASVSDYCPQPATLPSSQSSTTVENPVPAQNSNTSSVPQLVKLPSPLKREPSPAGNGNITVTPQTKKLRPAYSNAQLLVLEKTFRHDKNPSKAERTEISNQLGLTESKVDTWFQNRRTKDKKASGTKKAPVPFDLFGNGGK